jgi:hypothetical protein
MTAPDAVTTGVLAEHVALGDDAEGIEQCSCGALAIWRRDSADDEDEVRYLPTHAEGPDLRWHRAHVAAALVAAGIGPVAQAKVEALREAAKYLRRHGAALFNKRGPQDARGAGLWDAGCAIDPDDGDAFSVGHAAPPEDTP